MFKVTVFEDVQFSNVALNVICRTRNKDATTQRSLRCWVMNLVTGSLVILSRILLSVRCGTFYLIPLVNVTFEKKSVQIESYFILSADEFFPVLLVVCCFNWTEGTVCGF